VSRGKATTLESPISRAETFATLPLFFGFVALRVFDYALPVVLADSGVSPSPQVWRFYVLPCAPSILLDSAGIRDLHSFPFQLNLSYSFHHITQLTS
jgi:hypothetical protein